MAKSMWMDPQGFWHYASKKSYWEKQNYWSHKKAWSKWEGDGSWACHTCDNYQKGIPDDYEGNYASGMECRICLVHKSHSHHMPMAERARKIQENPFLPREEARAERQKRKAKQTTKWIWDWAKGDYVEAELVEETGTIVQAAIKVEKGLISKEEFTKFVQEGPPKGKAVEEAQGVSAEVAVGTATTEGAEAPPLIKY